MVERAVRLALVVRPRAPSSNVSMASLSSGAGVSFAAIF